MKLKFTPLIILLLILPLVNSVELDDQQDDSLLAFRDQVTLDSRQIDLSAGKYIDRETGQILTVLESEESRQTTPTGYIIQLKQKPLTLQYQELESEAEKNNESLLKPLYDLSTVILPKRFEPTLFSNAEDKSEIIRNKILEEHSNFNQKAMQTLKKDKIARNALSQQNIDELVILNEYSKVFNGIALDITKEEAEKLEQLDEVEKVFPNRKVQAALFDSVPLINADDVWLLDKNGSNCATSGEECLTGKGVTIGIIDTGVDYSHADLGGCFGLTCKVIDGYDFVNNDNDPMDDNGHGTHVAATAAGNGALKGVAPDANVIVYKVLNSEGSGYWDDTIAAIERSVDPNEDGDFSDHLDVISLSLGGSGDPDDPPSQAIDNAAANGVVAVVAAGNSGSSEETISSPGTARKAITVGATDKNNVIAYFSSRGPVIWENGAIIKPDVVAPGVNICAAQWDDAFSYGDINCNNDNEHVAISGTSMATPHVSGAVALIKQKNPDWTPEEIKMALRNTAVDIGEEINTQGYGFINVLSAINVKNKPLIAEIETSGTVYGGEVNIIGTAKGENFENYTLYYTTEEYIKSDLWTEICSSKEEKLSSILCNWDYRELEQGSYLFKLDVRTNSEESRDYVYLTIENTKIKTPKHIIEDKINWWDPGEILSTWKNIIINGTSTGYNFDHFEIELCDYESGICSNEAIILENDGLSPVINDVLGNIDGSKVQESGFYNLKLTTYYTDGREGYDTNLIYIETQLQKGWPIVLGIEEISGLALMFLDQPTIVDVDKDGKKDLVTAYGQTINVLNYEGLPLSGWPVTINYTTAYTTVQVGPAVADIDNDGFNEIVIGDNRGSIHVLNHDGTYVFEPKHIDGYLETPVIDDVNNDDNLDIIVGDWYGSLHVLDFNGNYLSGWPKFLEPIEGYPYFNGIWTAASTADINNDGYKEIFVVSSSCNQKGTCNSQNRSSRVWVFNYDGTILNGWPKDIAKNGGIYGSNIVVGDINEDYQIEIIAGSSNGTIYAWDTNGSDIVGWPVVTNARDLDEPSIGNIDNDSQLEILITGFNKYYGYCIENFAKVC